MFYDIRFSHVSRFEFLKAHPRVHCDLRYARVSIVEKIDFAERNKGITAYTRKSVRMGYDVRGTEGEGKTKGEKLRRTKRKEQRRTQKRAPELVPFAFIRSPRGHSALYLYPLRPASFCLLLFLLPRVNLSCFLFLIFPFPSSAPLSSSRAACSCRLCFIIPQLFRIHATPLQSLSSATLCHPSDHHILSLPSRGTITRPSVKYTFVGGPAMWRPVIYFSSNCNFSNTY